MAPTRIEGGLADDVRGNIGGKVIGECAAAEERGAGVLEIDQPAAALPPFATAPFPA
jgi:hypothetical protein